MAAVELYAHVIVIFKHYVAFTNILSVTPVNALRQQADARQSHNGKRYVLFCPPGYAAAG